MAHIPTKKDRHRRTVKSHPGWVICKCGKHGYKTQADGFAAAINASYTKGKPHRVYRCTISNSGLFHLTTQVPESLEAPIQIIDKNLTHVPNALDSIRKVHQANKRA